MEEDANELSKWDHYVSVAWSSYDLKIDGFYNKDKWLYLLVKKGTYGLRWKFGLKNIRINESQECEIRTNWTYVYLYWVLYC